MTWWMWLVVVAISAATFGLGAYCALVFGPKRPVDVDRVHAAVGVLLMVVALVVVVDIVYLQVDYRRFAENAVRADQEQIDCNRRTIEALMTISRERRLVDDQARMFDIALLGWLRRADPNDTPMLNALEQATLDVAEARSSMVKVYDSVDFPDCHG